MSCGATQVGAALALAAPAARANKPQASAKPTLLTISLTGD
jgi:hypothetical protein